MRLLSLAISLACLFHISNAQAQGLQTPNPMDAILHVVDQFAKSIDKQDPALARQVLHTSASHHYVTPQGFLTVSQAQFLGMLADKKVGGEDRPYHVTHTEVAGPSATVQILQDNGSLRFRYDLGLMHVEDAWSIVNVRAVMQASGQ